MRYLDLTLNTPELNLALDEILLGYCEAHPKESILRIWEPKQYFVVLGYSNRIETETFAESCNEQGISIYRRMSGGGTVLQGPGCLNYSLILRIQDRTEFQNITRTNCYILNEHSKLVSKLLGQETLVQGHSDMTLGGLKFSGNAQRRLKQTFLFHGTFLLNFNLEKISATLRMPSLEPDYRKHRAHQEFLTNLNIQSDPLKQSLKNYWNAHENEPDFLIKDVESLASNKYRTREWNYKF